MRKLKKITILIPCHNEEQGIGSVIDGIPRRLLHRIGFKTEIMVINNPYSRNECTPLGFIEVEVKDFLRCFKIETFSGSVV